MYGSKKKGMGCPGCFIMRKSGGESERAWRRTYSQKDEITIKPKGCASRRSIGMRTLSHWLLKEPIILQQETSD